jgi:predicted dehydrogenase
MRRNGALAADYARRHGVPRWYDDAQALIDDPEVDAVYIATPPSTHKPYAIMCAQARKPTYVEKPMGLTYAECQEMLAAFEDAGVPIFVAYYRRCLPRFLKAKELVQSGAIGQVRFVSVRFWQKPPAEGYDRSALPWRVVPEISGGGHFVDLACHTLDYLDHVLGPIAQACGHATNHSGAYEAEDLVTASLQFASGVQASGVWCFTAYDDLDVIEIVGDSGLVRLSTFGTEPVQWIRPDGSTEFAIANPPHVAQPIIQSVVDDLLGRGICPSTGHSAARTNWVLDQVLADYPSRLALS